MSEKVKFFDICIVGGSIAGNYLAYLLSKLPIKLNIAVIEEHREIGLPFQCAGIVSMKLDKLIDLPKEIILNRVKTAKIVAPSGKTIKLAGKERPYIINRIALDKLFYEKIKNKSNISYFLGEKFKSLKYLTENGEKYVIIETSHHKIKVKMIIGCDGPFSFVGKHMGIRNDIIYAAQVRAKAGFPQDEAAMYFDPRWKELFGWIVPEGDNGIYRIGIASKENISYNFKIFLKKLNISDDKILDRQGGVIPYGYMKEVAFDNCLLLGDAACQVKATTGGGIVMLLTAAKIAAYCILKCFENGNFSKKFIKKHYQLPCSRKIGRQLKIHYFIRSIFEIFTPNDFDTFFQIVKSNQIESIISLYGDMDFPLSLLIRLFRNSLFLKFFFGIIKSKFFSLIKIFKNLIKK